MYGSYGGAYAGDSTDRRLHRDVVLYRDTVVSSIFFAHHIISSCPVHFFYQHVRERGLPELEKEVTRISDDFIPRMKVLNPYY